MLASQTSWRCPSLPTHPSLMPWYGGMVMCVKIVLNFDFFQASRLPYRDTELFTSSVKTCLV